MQDTANTGQPLNVGFVGGGMMGMETHPEGCRQASAHPFNKQHPFNFVPHMICTTKEATAESAAGAARIPHWTTDPEELVRGCDIIDICTPNSNHLEIVLLAAKHGKHIWCEKPLGVSLADSVAICEALEQGRSQHATPMLDMVHFCYRFNPAIQRIKRLIDEGRIFDALDAMVELTSQFLQDYGMNESMPQGGTGLWRLAVEKCGRGGVIGDLMEHCWDLILFLLGPQAKILNLVAMNTIVVAERPHADKGSAPTPITAVDTSTVMCRFDGGARGTFEASRFRKGYKAFFGNRIGGRRGAAEWELEHNQYAHLYEHQVPNATGGWDAVPDHTRGTKVIHVSDDKFRGGLSGGYSDYFAREIAAFGARLSGETDLGTRQFATFRDGLITAALTEAAVNSGDTNAWVTVRYPDYPAAKKTA